MSAPRPTRLESVLPWVAILAASWVALFPIASVDAYYHLATGLRILETRTIPDRGVGSATFGRVPWHDNEWGFQALAATLGRTVREPSGVLSLAPSGRVALIGMRACTIAATLAFVAATCLRMGVRPGLAAACAWLAAFLTFGNLFWDIRPQILSYLALAALAYVLERCREGSAWAAAAGLGVIALWSNVHGAFVVGFGLIGCEALGAWIESRRDPALRSKALRLSALTLAAPLAACLNPLGWRQVVHPLTYMTRPEIYAGNNEWTRPDLVHLPLLVLTFALLAAAVALGGRPRPGLLLRVALFAVLFSTAIRHLPLVAIVVVPVLGSTLTGAARQGGWREVLEPFGRFGRRPWGMAATAVILAGVIVGLSGAKFIGLVPRFGEHGVRPLPEAEVRYLARHRISGNGFNAYRFGGFLMFRLYPDERVFMDGRNDLYGEFRERVYDPIYGTQPGWEPVWRDAVRRYGLGWVLVDADAPLARSLAADSQWIRVPADRLEMGGAAPGGEAALFLVASGANRSVLGLDPRSGVDANDAAAEVGTALERSKAQIRH